MEAKLDGGGGGKTPNCRATFWGASLIKKNALYVLKAIFSRHLGDLYYIVQYNTRMLKTQIQGVARQERVEH